MRSLLSSSHVIKRASLTVSPGIPIIIANQCSGVHHLCGVVTIRASTSSPACAQDPITRTQVPSPTSPAMAGLAVVFSAGRWLPRRSAHSNPLYIYITDGAFRRAILYGGVCSAETRPPPCRGKSGDTAPQELFVNHPGSQLTDRSRLIQAPHSSTYISSSLILIHTHTRTVGSSRGLDPCSVRAREPLLPLSRYVWRASSQPLAPSGSIPLPRCEVPLSVADKTPGSSSLANWHTHDITVPPGPRLLSGSLTCLVTYPLLN